MKNFIIILVVLEEEYLKGPGMFFKGNPEKYYTIIRYRVGKIFRQDEQDSQDT